MAVKELSEITSSMDLPYMRILSYALHFMAAWPYKALGINKGPWPLRSTRTLFCVWFSCLVAEIAYVKTNMNVISFFELGHTYITMFMTCISTQRVTMPWTQKYVDTTTDFVTKIHLLYFKHKSDYAMEVFLQVDKLCAIFMKFLYLQMLCGIFLFNFTPLFNNFRHGMFSSNPPVNGTYELAVYYQWPIKLEKSFSGYVVMSIINLILTFDCASAFCTFDLYLSIIVFHLWGHLKILKHNLENFRTPKMKGYAANSIENPAMFTEEESEEVTELIKDCINYHSMIKEFMNLTSDAFGPSICLYYAFHQVSGCILLLECSRLDTEALGRYGILTLIIFQQLIQLSTVFELLGSKSETLKDAVYSVPWECMDPKNRRIFCFYLYNVQEPLKLKAGGIVPVGVQTMAAILKTSFSYFMLLRTVAMD